MKCESRQELMLQGEIDQEHLKQCDVCRSFWQTLEQLKQFTVDDKKSPLLFDDVYKAAASQNVIMPVVWQWTKYMASVAAALFLVVSVGSVQFKSDRRAEVIALSKAIPAEIENLNQLIDSFEEDLTGGLISREMTDLSDEIDHFLV